MPSYSGKLLYADKSGQCLSQGSCQLTFDDETFTVTPAAGAPIGFDLGDIDRFTSGDFELQLTLYTDDTLTLKQFGTAFSRMSGELLAAWRDRTVRCLLLEDLEELGRYHAAANGAPGELRIYGSNIAFIPQLGLPIQWRLAEVGSIQFDTGSYSIVLTRGGDRLVLSKLAKKTDEALAKLQSALTAIRENAAVALHNEFPFLSPGQLSRLWTVMPEGASASLSALSEIHPKLPDALIARAVDEPLKPYFDALKSRATSEPLMAGFKFLRPDDANDAEAEPGEQAGRPPLFFWFFFPLSNHLAAWEATTGSGRATYFFRAPAPFAAAVEQLTRGLALVNFRREPVYLPDESLELQPRFHRYAIGARKLPELRSLRAAYFGRAIHSTPEEWQAQVDASLGGQS